MNQIDIENELRVGTKLALTQDELNKFNAYLDRNNIKLGYNTFQHDSVTIISKRD